MPSFQLIPTLCRPGINIPQIQKVAISIFISTIFHFQCSFIKLKYTICEDLMRMSLHLMISRNDPQHFPSLVCSYTLHLLLLYLVLCYIWYWMYPSPLLTFYGQKCIYQSQVWFLSVLLKTQTVAAKKISKSNCLITWLPIIF
jgi:hypothetical protein